MRGTFRIGSTSFVHPAGWLENARRLAGRVSDVELLLFEPPGEGGGPSPGEVAGLARLAAETGLTYCVHAPLELALGSEDPARRAAAVEAVRAAAAVTAPLRPHALVVHLALGEREGGAPPADVRAWQRRAIASLERVLDGGPPAADVCLETLEYDFALAEPVVAALGLSVALDAGHLLRDGVAPGPVLDRNLARSRVVQWHGTEPGGRDHRSIRHVPRAEARALLDRLAAEGWGGVLTLEVFREGDLDDSLAVLAELEAERAREARR